LNRILNPYLKPSYNKRAPSWGYFCKQSSKNIKFYCWWTKDFHFMANVNFNLKRMADCSFQIRFLYLSEKDFDFYLFKYLFITNRAFMSEKAFVLLLLAEKWFGNKSFYLLIFIFLNSRLTGVVCKTEPTTVNCPPFPRAKLFLHLCALLDRCSCKCIVFNVAVHWSMIISVFILDPAKLIRIDISFDSFLQAKWTGQCKLRHFQMKGFFQDFLFF